MIFKRHVRYGLTIITGYFLISIFYPAITLGATIYTNSTAGNDTTGDGSSGNPYKTFHKAYTSASSGDTINLTGTFDWSNTDETGDSAATGYTISKNITIQGQIADETFIQASTTENATDRRVLTIPSGQTVTINNVTIRYGKVGSYDGAGIHISGTGYINSSTISYNRSTDGSGGGIDVRGSLTITDSTINNNKAHYMGGGTNRNYYSGSGGTPSSSDLLTIVNCTIAYNEVTQTVAYLEGGGVFFRRGEGYITNSTIAYNQVVNSQPSTHGLGSGDSSVTVRLKNNIIAANIHSGTYEGDLGHRSSGSQGTFVDNGGNIIGRLGYYSSGYSAATSSWIDQTNSSGAIDGIYALQNGGNTTGTLGLSDTLLENGSTNGTLTLAINSSSSVAINNGLNGSNGSTTIPTADQRGLSRSGSTDIGAYEYGGGGIDTTSPIVSSFSPLANATGVSPTTSLTITFSENITASSGVITIKKSSDDTLFGSFNANDTSTITISSNQAIINPSSSLAEGVVYYITVSSSSFSDSSSNFYAGITSTSSWSFTTSDTTAPIMNTVTSTVSTSTTIITWTTNEAASSLVSYGPGSNYSTSTLEINTSTRTTNHSITLSNLSSCTTYHYRTQSTDSFNNQSTSTDNNFTTLGCTGSASIINSTSTVAPTSTQTTTTLMENGTGINLIIPSGYATSTAYFQIKKINQDSALSTTGSPSNYSAAQNHTYQLLAIADSLQTISTFNASITIAITYTSAEIVNIDESTLQIFRWDGNSWNGLSGCSVNTSTKIVSCTTMQFSTFTLFGQPSNSESSPGNVIHVAANYSQTQTPIEDSTSTSKARISSSSLAFSQSEHYKQLKQEDIISPSPASTTSTTRQTMIIPPYNGRDLTGGKSGNDVKALQEFLIGENTGPKSRQLSETGATGYFGKLTKAALAEYQNASGILPAQGYFGWITRMFLRSIFSSNQK
ncbi:MAG: Ig-like domain-containing protein [Anaplasmataceae bacterium]|nr:Ig-like domain-containing protein [Anaplasmataceae bacterium]